MKKTICNSILISFLLSSGLYANTEKSHSEELNKNKKEIEIKEEKQKEKSHSEELDKNKKEKNNSEEQNKEETQKEKNNNLIKKITTNITVVTTTEIIQKNPDNTETIISKTIDSPVTDETIDIVNPEDKIIKDDLTNVQEIIEKSKTMTKENKEIYLSEKIKLVDAKIKSIKKKINEIDGNENSKENIKKTDEIKEEKSNKDIDKEILKLNENLENKKIEDYSKHL